MRQTPDFDDQCTGANPRFPLIHELKQIRLDAYDGRIPAQQDPAQRLQSRFARPEIDEVAGKPSVQRFNAAQQAVVDGAVNLVRDDVEILAAFDGVPTKQPGKRAAGQFPAG